MCDAIRRTDPQSDIAGLTRERMPMERLVEGSREEFAEMKALDRAGREGCG